MIDPEAVKGLVDAGGWTAFLMVCGFLGIGFVRGWIVPGWMYRRSEERLEKIEAALVKLTEAVRRRA